MRIDGPAFLNNTTGGIAHGTAAGKADQTHETPATQKPGSALGGAARDSFERPPGAAAFEQLVKTPGTALLGGKSDLPEATVYRDASGGRPKGGIDQRWVDRYKVLEDWRKRFDNTLITPENRDEQESLRFMIQGLEGGLGLQPGQRAVVNGGTGEYVISPPQSDTNSSPQFFNFRDPESIHQPNGEGGARIGPQPGQGGALTGGGGAGGGGSIGGSPGGADGNPAGVQFGVGIAREPGSTHGHEPNSGRGRTPVGPGPGPRVPGTPSSPHHPSSPGQAPSTNTDKDKANKVHDTGTAATDTKSTMAVVDKLIASWDIQDSGPKTEGGEELSSDPSTGHGSGGGSDDVGGRSHLPGRPRGVTQQQLDLVGPAIAKKAGADDEEEPVTGSISGRPSTQDLDNDLGGPHMFRPSGGTTVGNLMHDLRKVSPIDPSKV